MLAALLLLLIAGTAGARHPLEPADTSSPRATIDSFLAITEETGRRYLQYRDSPSPATMDALYRMRDSFDDVRLSSHRERVTFSACNSYQVNLAIVNFAGASDAAASRSDRYGHSYFRDAPTVSSDLVLLLRDDLDPGTPGRPLESLGRKFWGVPPGYPAVQ